MSECVITPRRLPRAGRVPKKIIHVNQHKIKANGKTGARDPVLTCKTTQSNNYAHQAQICDRSGEVIATVVYSPDKPLSCGAKVWIETYGKVVLVSHNQADTVIE